MPGTRPRSFVDGLKFGLTDTGDMPTNLQPLDLIQRNAADTAWQRVAPGSLGISTWIGMSDTDSVLTETNFTKVQSGQLKMFDLLGSANAFTGGNTFSGVNTFSNGNTHSGANTFSGINTFSNRNFFNGQVAFTAVNTFTTYNYFQGNDIHSGDCTFSGTNGFTGVNTFSNDNIHSGDNTISGNNTFSNTNDFTADQTITGAGLVVDDGNITPTIVNSGIIVGSSAGGGAISHTNAMGVVVGATFDSGAGTSTVRGTSTYGGMLVGRAANYSSGNALIDHNNYGYASLTVAGVVAEGTAATTIIQAGQANLTVGYLYGGNAVAYHTSLGKANIAAVYEHNLTLAAYLYSYQTGKSSILAAYMKPSNAAGNFKLTQSGKGVISAVYALSRARLNNVTHSSAGGLMAIYLKRGDVTISGDGALVSGKVGLNGSTGYMTASGDSTVILGFPANGDTMSATAACAMAFGRSQSGGLAGNISATAVNAVQWWTGTNADTNSMGFGESFKIWGEDTDTAKTVNGDFWKTATGGHSSAHTGGYDRSLSLIPGDAGGATVTGATHTVTDEGVIAADCVSNAITVYLPASPIEGRIVVVKKIDASAYGLTINGNGNNIDGAATKGAYTTQWDKLHVVFGPSNWYIQ